LGVFHIPPILRYDAPRSHTDTMTPAEITIVCLVYIATLLLGQRGAAFVLPDAQEIAFLLAAVIASAVAGYLYYSRERKRASVGVVFSVAGPMAVLAIVLGQLTQLLWQPFTYPLVALAAGAGATLLLPFVLFPVGRMLAGEHRAAEGESVGLAEVLMVGVFAIASVIGAAMLPAPGHSSIRLDPQTFPGVTVSLPAWQPEEKTTAFGNGSVRLADPAGGDHFISIRWLESGPVQADDDIKAVASAMEMETRDRSLTNVGGHEGVTFYLESPDRTQGAAVTIWYCSTDRRLFRIVSKLIVPKASMLATHQHVIDSVKCHSSEGRGSTQPQAVFPSFTAPPGFVRDVSGAVMFFSGPRKQTIAFYPAVPGRHALVDAVVSPDQVAAMLKSTGSLTTIDQAPQLLTTSDLLGHERRVWSAAGNNAEGNHVQVEVMVWWCDRRDMTFLGAYVTPAAHDPREGVNAMLPAVCHRE
jgi:hypothetical protein